MEGTDMDSFDEIDTAVCPLCGGEAEWGFMDEEMTRAAQQTLLNAPR